LDTNVLNSLNKYKGTSKLKKAAMNVLVKMLKPKEIEHLREEFQKIDTDCSGIITADELDQALKASKISTADIEKIITEIDYDGNKDINYSEFLAATIQIS
jgi:calcium-dependent protein kinase